MNRIKQLRSEANMTQEELAAKLHVKRPVVSKYENGTVPLTDFLILELSDIFNVSSDYLLGRSDSPTPLDKKRPLTNEEGNRLMQQAFAGTGLLTDDGQFSEEGGKIILDFITKNADMLKKLMDEPD